MVHRKSAPGRAPLGQDDYRSVFYWKTCLRQIAIVEDLDFSKKFEAVADYDEFLYGNDAYRFLLQVICGLHSPLLGETEVYGQFKNAVSQHAFPATPFGGQLQRFFRLLFEDAKKVRQQHLEDLGSQSYGSILRRETKNLSKIHLLGAGHLVQEILPWIAKDGKEIHLHCRDIAKVRRSLSADFPELHVHDIQSREIGSDVEALVIAAPVNSEWITEWLGDSIDPDFVADLRADSLEDRLMGYQNTFTLDEFFNLLTQNQALLEARKSAALITIDSIVQERARHVEYRPFGWEDVCA